MKYLGGMSKGNKCPKCDKPYTWGGVRVHTEQFEFYDQLWYTCLKCGTTTKRAWMYKADREEGFCPRCPINLES
jgi:RNase P subunit RPR2